MSHTLIVKFEFLKGDFSDTIRYIRLNFLEITEILMLLQDSEVLFY